MSNRAQKKWTLEELHSLPDDGNKYELIRGELFVTPAPTVSHETIVARLTRILDRYVAANNLGYVFHRGAVINEDEYSEVEPDLMVRQPPDSEDASWAVGPLPILVVEVASDSTRRRDRVRKRGIYADAGIPEYWMVDGRDRTIRIIRPGLEDVTTRESLVWHPDGVDTPLVISVADVLWPLPKTARDS